MRNAIENHSLTRKIAIFLIVKLSLLFCLWKLCFSHPLPKELRREGVISRIYTNGDSA